MSQLEKDLNSNMDHISTLSQGRFTNRNFLEYSLGRDTPASEHLRNHIIKLVTGYECQKTTVIEPKETYYSDQIEFDLLVEDEKGQLFNIQFCNNSLHLEHKEFEVTFDRGKILERYDEAVFKDEHGGTKPIQQVIFVL